MRCYTKAIIIIVFIIPVDIFSQQLPSIQTDRPDQTECPFIVPKNHFQIEAGYVYEKDNEIVTTSIPTTLLKYGLSDNFELRLILDVSDEKHSHQTMPSQGSIPADTGFDPRLNPVEIGFKVNISKEHGIIPTASLIGHLMIPEFLSDINGIIYYAPNFRFCMQNTLSDRISLGYNLGAEWDGINADPTFIYTLTTGASITDKIGAYVELYGFAPQKSKADHRFDAGVTYLFRKNLQLDISGGTGLTNNAPDYFLGFGLSVRFPD